MRVLCVTDTAPEVKDVHGIPHPKETSWPITVGQEYSVLGLLFVTNDRALGSGAYLYVIWERVDYIMPMPLCLFRITEPHVPPWWIVVLEEDGAMELVPPSFRTPYFLDKLSDGNPEEMEAVEEEYRKQEEWAKQCSVDA